MAWCACFACFASVALATETVTVQMPEGVPVVCTAEHIDYQWAKKTLTAQGNVILKYTTITLQADTMSWDVESGDIVAEGHIILHESASRAVATRIRYNLPKRTAWMAEVEVVSGPWTIRGKEVKRPTEKDAYFIDGYLTTCEDHANPHSKLAAGEIHVVIDDMIEASNVLFYTGPVPVFWIPYFSRSMKDGKSPFEIRPGFSSTEGWFLKARYNLYGANGFSFDVYGDYLEKLGYGFGAQSALTWDNGGRNRLYVYGVVDPSSARQRWQFNMEHQQNFGPDISAVARADFNSDETFATDRHPYYTVSRYLRSYGAGTYRFTFGTFLLSAQEDSQFSPVDGAYHRTYAELPRLSFQTVSLPLGYGWSAGLGLEGVRSVLLPNAFHASELWGWRTRVNPFTSYFLPIWPGVLTVGTSANWTTTWDELKSDTGAPQGAEGFTHGYGAGASVHTEWYPGLFSTDFGYSYSQQLYPLIAKGGVTSNRLGATASMGQYGKVNLRVTTGFNLLPDRSELVSEIQRYDPVFAELLMQSEGVQYRYATQYDVLRSAFTFVDNAIRAMTISGIEFQTGINFSRDVNQVPLSLDLYGSLTLPVRDVFRLEAGYRYELLNDLLKEQRYGVLWNFIDCWTFRATYAVRSSLVGTLRTDTSFFWFDIRLKAFPIQGPPIPIPGVIY